MSHKDQINEYGELKRWKITVIYKGAAKLDEVWFIDEIEEMDELVESGDPWELISHWIVTYNLGDKS